MLSLFLLLIVPQLLKLSIHLTLFINIVLLEQEVSPSLILRLVLVTYPAFRKATLKGVTKRLQT
jgi:hypothetical protein